MGPQPNKPPVKHFDTRLDGGIRDFQRRYRLKVDGLINPGGPTAHTLGRILARPPLKNLSAEAVSANVRLVRHLMMATADGIVPDLMAGDFRANEAGRAKTADFLSQMFTRDPDRAKSLHAKAREIMTGNEKTLLDRLILQARKADDDDEPTPDDPGHDDDPDDDDEPTPDDPGQDDDPDDDAPENPEEPEKPKPDEETCKQLEVDIANTQATIDDQEAQIQDTEQNLAALRRELESLEAENSGLDIGSTATGIISTIFPLLRLTGTAAGAVMSGKAAVNENRIKALKKQIPELERRLELFRHDLEALKAKLADLKAKLEKC